MIGLKDRIAEMASFVAEIEESFKAQDTALRADDRADDGLDDGDDVDPARNDPAPETGRRN